MISEFVDGFAASIRKNKTLSGYAGSSRDGIRFMDLGLCTIRYRVAGKGDKTLVFETDPPVVIEHYDYLVDILGDDYTIVIFEPPGFGFSVPSVRLDYRYDTVVSITEQFLDRLNMGPVALVAPCVLGYGGIGLADKRPDLVSHLILSQVPSWEEIMKWKLGRDPKGMLSKPVLSQLLLKALKKKRTPLWYQKALGNKELLDKFNSISQESYQHGATFNLASGFQRLMVGTSPVPSNISAKTLFLWGQKDDSHCHTCRQSSLDMIPDAQLIKIEESGHFPELETPDLVAGYLNEFIHQNTVKGVAV